jgi:hypothetical protein
MLSKIKAEYFQIISIIASIFFIVNGWLYDKLDVSYAVLSDFNKLIVDSGIVASITFILGGILVLIRRKVNKLFYFNLLIVLYPLFMTILLIMLVNSGFGPPS